MRACFGPRWGADSHPGQFPLQARVSFGTFENVRIIVVLGTLLAGTCVAPGQQQEDKLIDRLLRPNLSLTNPAQNKTFSNTRTTTLRTVAQTKNFSAIRTTVPKQWIGSGTVAPVQFVTRNFRTADLAATVSTRLQFAQSNMVAATSAAAGRTRVAAESSASPATAREFAGVRPFLGKGKSEEALQSQNRPLTIEQVRELLNKSK